MITDEVYAGSGTVLLRWPKLPFGFEKREMSRGTYLTHRLDPKGLALSLTDVSRLSLLDHLGQYTP